MGFSDFAKTIISTDPGQQSLDKLFGTSVAKDATRAQERSATQATEAQLEMFYKALELQQPFIDFGKAALPGISAITNRAESGAQVGAYDSLAGLFRQLSGGPDPNDPGFKFREKQLNEQLDRRLAGSGKLDSRQGLDVIREGNLALTASESDRQLSRISQQIGLTSGYVDQLAGRENIPYQRLLDAVRISQGASGQAGAYSINTGNTLAGIFQNQGNQISQIQQNQANQSQQAIGTGLGVMGLFL